MIFLYIYIKVIMRKQDKKKHMEEANKIFQERIENPDKFIQTEEVDTYVYTKDIFPELSKILKYS